MERTKRYFTGVACGRGHVAERYASGGCCQCRAENAHAWRLRHPSENTESMRRQAERPDRKAARLLRAAKERARKHDLPFDITLDDVLPALLRGVCEATGLPFDFRSGNRRMPFVPSIDRIEPVLGYTRGNIQIVVWALNAARGPWGDAVFLQVTDAFKTHRMR